jgi:DMSO/TMAO reductase YedYZ heme-binding membrane subunit
VNAESDKTGPVTAFTKIMARSPEGKVSAFLLRAWPLFFVLPLVYVGFKGRLMDYADPVIGFDAVLAMIACLAVTPLITLAKMPVAKLRWWYGNWVFFLGAAGLELHLVYPPVNPLCGMAGNSVNWTGTLIIALLLPMTATSSNVAQRLLGPEWKRWQRWLVWAVWGAIAVHLAVMHAWLPTAAYLLATSPAIVLRRPAVRRSVKAWRADGYSTLKWWVWLAVLGNLAATGIIILVAEEVHAIASAVAGA